MKTVFDAEMETRCKFMVAINFTYPDDRKSTLGELSMKEII